MRVKDKILYQVARNRNYKVGEKIHFGEENNGQMKIFDFEFNIDGKPLWELGFNSAKKGIFKDKDLIFKMSNGLANYDLFMREIVLEKVRREKFPHLPSRFKCMFLSDNKEVVVKNLKIMAKKEPGNFFQAVAVKVNGEVFYSKDFKLDRPGVSFNDYKQIAEKYWSQNQNSDETVKEILFVGDAEIVEVFGDSNSI